jgi:ubiquitin-conjugating enzyme E2 S
MPEDLTQLTILLTGPQGTPYAAGVWKLHLKIPHDYPKSPPKASFRTKIWHPNVEESTGSICVDTLKRDWSSKLTLRDILIVGFVICAEASGNLTLSQTVSCLLIHPNPDSALNSAAGHLLQEDYSAFAAQAKLMTSIHAVIPSALRDAVAAAQRRGEDSSRPAPLKLATGKRPHVAMEPTPPPTSQEDSDGESEWDDENDSKENDPNISPMPFTQPNLPQRPRLAKRPLSDLPTPVESPTDDEDEHYNGMTPSERNIAANTPLQSSRFDFAVQTPNLSSNIACLGISSTHDRPMAKLPERHRGSGSFNFSTWMKEQDTQSSSSAKGLMITPFEDKFNFSSFVSTEEDSEMQGPRRKRVCSDEVGAPSEEKENITEVKDMLEVKPLLKTVRVEANVGRKFTVASGNTAGTGKVKPRIGLRRL